MKVRQETKEKPSVSVDTSKLESRQIYTEYYGKK